MSYTPPLGNAANLQLNSAFSVPLGSAANLTFGSDLTGLRPLIYDSGYTKQMYETQHVDPVFLGSGTADSTTHLRGDGTWNTSVAAVNAQVGTTYTFTLADSSASDNSPIVTLTNAAPVTATIPPNSSVAFPLGAVIQIVQLGAGKVTVAAGTGVTISNTNKSVAAQFGQLFLLQTAINTWALVGPTIA